MSNAKRKTRKRVAGGLSLDHQRLLLLTNRAGSLTDSCRCLAFAIASKYDKHLTIILVCGIINELRNQPVNIFEKGAAMEIFTFITTRDEETTRAVDRALARIGSHVSLNVKFECANSTCGAILRGNGGIPASLILNGGCPRCGGGFKAKGNY